MEAANLQVEKPILVGALIVDVICMIVWLELEV